MDQYGNGMDGGSWLNGMNGFVGQTPFADQANPFDYQLTQEMSSMRSFQDPSQYQGDWQNQSPVEQQHPHQTAFGELNSLAGANGIVNSYGLQQHTPQQRLSVSRGLSSAGSDASNGHGNRVPIPHANSSLSSQGGSPGQQLHDQPMVIPASGPMSSSVTVPSRPRPGRKPIPQEDAADRRRVQNRIAQRNFRDKRQQKLSETQAELMKNKNEYQEKFLNMERQLEALRQQVQQANRRAAEAEQRAEQRAKADQQKMQSLEQQLQTARQKAEQPSLASFRPATISTTGASPYTNQSAPTPPEESSYEIDFTNYGRTNQSNDYQLRNTVSHDSNQMDFTLDGTDDRCGFCTDDQNCACREEAKAQKAAEPTPSSVTGPGSCDMCRADPERARQCRDLANAANMSVRSLTGDAPHPIEPKVRSDMGPPGMSCSEMVARFQAANERTSSISSLFGGKALHPRPNPAGHGYEFEETEAAEVLSALSRRSTMVESPQADSRRSSAASPHTQTN